MNKLLITKDLLGNVTQVEGDKVVYYGPQSEAPECVADETLDASGAVVRAGHVCSHTHMYSALCPFGMPPVVPKPENFLQILQSLWWRLDRCLDEEILRISARIYVAESLLKGTTSIVDHQESPNFIEGSLDVLADALGEFGARGLLTYGATDRNFGTSEGRRGIDECVRFIKQNKNPLVYGMIGLHASFTCEDETLRYAAKASQETGRGVHVHVAEGTTDVEDAVKRGYEGPAQRLDQLGCLTPGSIFVHCIHMSPSEVREIAKSGVWFVQNPRSNNGNEVGFPLSLRYAQKVALGVDGYNADMAQELDFAKKKAEEVGEYPYYMDHRLSSGLRMMGEFFDAEFGELNSVQRCRRACKGVAADLQVVREDGSVKHTIVAGKPVVVDGKLVGGDIEQLRSEAQKQADRLWKAMSEL